MKTHGAALAAGCGRAIARQLVPVVTAVTVGAGLDPAAMRRMA